MFVAGDLLCCAQLATKGTLDVELLKIEQQWFGLDGCSFKNPRSHLSKRPIQVNKRHLTNKVRKKGQTRKGSIHEQVEDEFDEFEDIN